MKKSKVIVWWALGVTYVGIIMLLVGLVFGSGLTVSLGGTLGLLPVSVLTIQVLFRRLGKSQTFTKRLRRPTDTTLGKPDDMEETNLNSALDKIHSAACYGKPRQ